MIHQLQRLPFLALLLLLAASVTVLYKLDVILGFAGAVGEKSVKILLVAAGSLVAVACLFVLLLIVLNYRLRKKSMDYQYKTEMGQRFGIIFLDDRTVINSDGKVLIQGKNWKDRLPQLPAATAERPHPAPLPAKLSHPADVET
jgi:membrane protein implicated in regulation of membrane protease activity